MSDGADTGRALAALALDPGGLGGLVLRARAGPARAALEVALARLPGPARRIHPDTPDAVLFGGLDVAASLAAGRQVRSTGLDAAPCHMVLPMAERTRAGLAARLGQMLDAARGHCLIALDEGAEPDEAAPPALAERLAFHIDLSETRAGDVDIALPAPADLDAARSRLAATTLPEGAATTLTALAARFGIHSLRAPLMALRAARALAALDGAAEATDNHLREAAGLVYPARATLVPEAEQTPEEESPTPPEAQDGAETDDDGTAQSHLPDEILVAAIAARLPAGLLDPSGGPSARRGPSANGGAGDRQAGRQRGRPLPARPGPPDGRARIDPVATLRAAAPWQTLRRAAQNSPPGQVIVRPADIHLARYETRRDRLLIFAVDASGSAALARLAEAKGAVELLLAQAYAQRDQVALVAFRGDGAEVLLPPTRSLVQAKRRLAGLPGGGGTPLAAGLLAAGEMAAQARRQGLSPLIACLTDGRGNIALDGTPGREGALADALAMAGRLSGDGIPALLIDTAARPGPQAADIAATMGARYLALPRADAARLSAAIGTARDDLTG
ncbi:magnesium chelatase subunit D [Roseovarius ramblicola]|uniref:Magnesium chelatase subunit D n=1 Tax=Roseovarius ramblicola TaxID=2022336 RepID=A0ABV5I538_9RHOB